MIHKNENDDSKKLYKNLKIDCEKCFGFCCVALYFSSSEGFPTDKDAGKPCINLKSDFKCTVHKNLREKGLKGCTAYDCFGAGQKVAQITYEGQDWRNNPESSKEMFDVFLVMRQIHEMLWYLTEAFRLQSDKIIREKIDYMIKETEKITKLDASSILKLDLVMHRAKVNSLLLKTSESLRNEARKGAKSDLKRKKKISGRLNLIGSDLRKANLKGEDLCGALLIASDLRNVDLTGTDLIGADLRDADLRGANLSNSIFITQLQINAAKGDSNTKLPLSIVRPTYWEK
ncbi:Uncharacterized protein YjbI, contains pentapeptide repeats [Clostridium cavendishii DSM 21758]|uniref:Uncharacterized protein YjbI, contains pentapeptide repeats n=1 Tax=Clostridium cavendishii DSM 21758 TaxID=1121302 RepID=A0A1M6NG08_9CLOT|nr:pentapeptide repeat-containing protein [Clostridium cavendishii]SHJ94698.1 Uncharacterized protein YjbI, contains pentapeptide repeats [Clostridium cavendishii DSM 21758]